MTHFENWVFLLCPDFVPKLKNLMDKRKSKNNKSTFTYYRIIMDNVDLKTHKKTQNIL